MHLLVPFLSWCYMVKHKPNIPPGGLAVGKRTCNMMLDATGVRRSRVACRVRLNVYRRDAFARIIATNFPGAEEGVKAKRDVRPVHHIQIL